MIFINTKEQIHATKWMNLKASCQVKAYKSLYTYDSLCIAFWKRQTYKFRNSEASVRQEAVKEKDCWLRGVRGRLQRADIFIMIAVIDGTRHRKGLKFCRL